MFKKKNELHKLETKILSLFKSKSKAVLNYKQVAGALNVKDTKGRNYIIKVLNGLLNSKQLKSFQKGQFQYNTSEINKKTSLLTIIPSGKGVVIVDGHNKELIVPKKELNKGLNGDIVEVSIHKKNNGFEAHIEKIITRSKKEFVGVLDKQNDFGFVLCRNARMYTDLFIERSELKDYKNGEKVVAVFKSWDDNRDSPSGIIIKSLGIPELAVGSNCFRTSILIS